MTINNNVGEALVSAFGHQASYLDNSNILWRIVNNEWIGKRSVWTLDDRACCIEETSESNIKSWWCGKDSDYKEIFKRK